MEKTSDSVLPPINHETLLVRPATAAKMISVSRSKMYELLQTGEIPCVVVGGIKRVPVSALIALAKNCS